MTGLFFLLLKREIGAGWPVITDALSQAAFFIMIALLFPLAVLGPRTGWPNWQPRLSGLPPCSALSPDLTGCLQMICAAAGVSNC